MMSSSRVFKLLNYNYTIFIFNQVYLIGPEGSGLSQSGIVDMI